LGNKKNTMKDIIAIGNALVDIITVLENETIINELGYPKGSMQLIDKEASGKINLLTKNNKKIMSTGGSASNTIHGLAKLGLNTGYIGRIGKDELGSFFTSDLKQTGVETYLEYSDTPTGYSTALVTPDSERTFATFLGAAAELLPSMAEGEIIGKYKMIHIEGYLVQNYDLIEGIIEMAKKHQVKISLDLASFNVVEANLDFLRKMIPGNVDVLFANEEESKAFTGKEPEEALNEIAGFCDIAVVKIGAKGSLIKCGEKRYIAGAMPVKAIDTTGAGDQYAAGFLYGLIKEQSLDKCAEIGSLLAAKVIEDYGARIKESEWEEVIKRVEKIRVH
jgi:sugar/nucleoside kinase (ribokinase family)